MLCLVWFYNKEQNMKSLLCTNLYLATLSEGMIIDIVAYVCLYDSSFEIGSYYKSLLLLTLTKLSRLASNQKRSTSFCIHNTGIIILHHPQLFVLNANFLFPSKCMKLILLFSVCQYLEVFLC